MMRFITFLAVTIISFFTISFATPLQPLVASLPLQKRQDPAPYFPDQPPSCPICAQNYDSINSCAEAAPVLANFSMIIFNPGAFIDIIECACTDTFQSAFPQCVDCFVQTNQTQWLEPPQNLPAIVDGMRHICAIESALLGNVSGADGEVTPTSAAPTPTASTSKAKQVVVLAPMSIITSVALLMFGISLLGVL